MTSLIAAFAGFIAALLTNRATSFAWIQEVSPIVDPKLAIFFLGPTVAAVAINSREGSTGQAVFSGFTACFLFMLSALREPLASGSLHWLKLATAFLWWSFLTGFIVWIWSNRRQTNAP